MAQPYDCVIPIIAGNIEQSLLAVTSLQAEVFQTRDIRPTYNIHGESMSWVQFYEMLGQEASRLQKQLSQMQPFEFITAVRG